MKKNERRVAATIERTALKRFIKREREKWESYDDDVKPNPKYGGEIPHMTAGQMAKAILGEFAAFASGRVERITKAKGGL